MTWARDQITLKHQAVEKIKSLRLLFNRANFMLILQAVGSDARQCLMQLGQIIKVICLFRLPGVLMFLNNGLRIWIVLGRAGRYVFFEQDLQEVILMNIFIDLSLANLLDLEIISRDSVVRWQGEVRTIIHNLHYLILSFSMTFFERYAPLFGVLNKPDHYSRLDPALFFDEPLTAKLISPSIPKPYRPQFQLDWQEKALKLLSSPIRQSPKVRALQQKYRKEAISNRALLQQNLAQLSKNFQSLKNHSFQSPYKSSKKLDPISKPQPSLYMQQSAPRQSLQFPVKKAASKEQTPLKRLESQPQQINLTQVHLKTRPKYTPQPQPSIKQLMSLQERSPKTVVRQKPIKVQQPQIKVMNRRIEAIQFKRRQHFQTGQSTGQNSVKGAVSRRALATKDPSRKQRLRALLKSQEV